MEHNDLNVKRDRPLRLGRWGSMAVLVGALVAMPVAANAASANTRTVSYAGNGYLLDASINKISGGTGVHAMTAVTSSVGATLPAGYMGGRGRVYSATSDALVMSSNWFYSPNPTMGIGVSSGTYGYSGNYYSIGATRLWNGNGYGDFSTNRTPNVGG